MVYAPFNHNGYAHTPQGWVFLGCFESALLLEVRVAEMQASGALIIANCKPANQRLAGFKRKTKVFAVIHVGLAVAFAIAFGVQQAFKAWPMILPVLMGVIFMGCAVALWWKQ